MKKLALLLVLVMTMTMFGACVQTEDAAKEQTAETSEPKTEDKKEDKSEPAAEPSPDAVEVTFLGTIKSEIGESFEAALAEYNASQDNYNVVVIPMDGSNAFEKMTALYASGNAPTMMVMGQEMATFKDRLLDLSDTEFTAKAFEGTTDSATQDGKVLGMPITVEGFGLLYNKTVLNEAVGGEFDPTSIQTRDDLKAVFDQIEATGKSAIHFSPMDWSLGAHLTNKMFSSQSSNGDERDAFMDELKAGSVELMSNDVFNGWMETFDLFMEYNINVESPLSADYDSGALDLGTGNVGFWFMGNWAYGPLHEADPDSDFGIMPVPVSNDSDGYGNSQISVGVPMNIVVDAEQSTPEQQAGAIDFLNWLVTSPEGQDYYVNGMNFIPVFEGFEASPSDSMSKEILAYTEAGKTLEWMNNKYPADAWPAMGASMQKYLDGFIGKEEMAAEIEDYWKNVE